MPTNSKEYMKANYSKYWGTAAAIKKRVLQNAARRQALKEWKVKKNDNMEVDHIKWTEKWNWKNNLRIITMVKNRRLWQKKAQEVKKKNWTL